MYAYPKGCHVCNGGSQPWGEEGGKALKKSSLKLFVRERLGMIEIISTVGADMVV